MNILAEKKNELIYKYAPASIAERHCTKAWVRVLLAKYEGGKHPEICVTQSNVCSTASSRASPSFAEVAREVKKKTGKTIAIDKTDELYWPISFKD